MKNQEILENGKKTSKKFWILYFICIFLIIVSAVIATERIDAEKPNATDLAENGAIGTESEKYSYLQIDGLTDPIAIYNEDEKCYIAINNNEWYIVKLSSTDLEELKDIQAYTYGEIENKPASVTVYGITEEVPDKVKEIAIDFYNEGLEEEQKITIDQFENYFGSVLLNTMRDPVDLTIETIIGMLSGITLFVAIIIQVTNKLVRMKVFKYLRKNDYEKELKKQLDDNIEETFFNEKLIITKDFIIDTTNGNFVAVKFSDIKWVYTHRLKYYGVVSISNSIIIILNDGKTQLQCLDTKGKISDEFEKVFEKICEKVPNDSLKGYTSENIAEFKEYKKNLKNNVI